MSQSNHSNQLAALSKVCEQLSDAVSTAPIKQMESQLNQQEQQTTDNIAWLDQAMNLLSGVSTVNDQTAQQLITKIESFVSESSINDYAKNSHVVETPCNLTEAELTGWSGLPNEVTSKNN
ncbi:MAG: hypothetical protein HRT35_35595 [Algicola sp.]|nr:hypothetical protein [Algicola sp.]